MMNVQETTGIRELSARELDHVTGGQISGPQSGFEAAVLGAVIGGWIAVAAGTLLDWLFGD
jgi:hypothetical protein